MLLRNSNGKEKALTVVTKSTYKSTHAVQNCVFQRPTMLSTQTARQTQTADLLPFCKNHDSNLYLTLPLHSPYSQETPDVSIESESI